MLTAVSEAPETRLLWLWQCPAALVAPKKMTANPAFGSAADVMERAGWPVHLRATGGDVTPQGPGIVNVTHAYSVQRAAEFSIAAEYDRLCRPIEAALGPGASRGWRAGAFCDGAYNVQLIGRKFAGTAMRFRPVRRSKGRVAVMAHALMLIKPPAPEAILALNRFLTLLGEPRRIEPQAHTGLPDGAGLGFLDRLCAAFEDLAAGPLTIERGASRRP